ncbi:MAG: GntR family transcriptional regulator [Lacrimispora celerecrescens]|nr:GntR family transcriptional regulator [Lacrimispora celerecrescens]
MTEENKEPKPRRIQKTDLKTQVETELLHFIKQMDLSVNNKLPREEELSRMLGVSRVTLRSVLDDLSAKGMIFRRHGKGTFINNSFFEMKASFNPVMHFVDMITSSGYKPRVEMIHHDIIKADRDVAAHLEMAEGGLVLICDKIFYADKQICAVTRDYIPFSYLNGVDMAELDNFVESVFYFMYKATGKKLEWDKVELNAVYSKEVELLNGLLERSHIPPKAFLLLKAMNYDEDGTAAVYTWEYVDTTILKYSQIRKRLLHYEDI